MLSPPLTPPLSARPLADRVDRVACQPLSVSPGEALHLGTLMAAHGYFFPISDHVLTLKDDGTFYRFQVGRLGHTYKSRLITRGDIVPWRCNNMCVLSNEGRVKFIIHEGILLYK